MPSREQDALRCAVDHSTSRAAPLSAALPCSQHCPRMNALTDHCCLSAGHERREDVNIVVVMRAMGVESDEEVLQLVGSEGAFATLLTPTLQHCKEEGVHTRQQALDYLAARVKGGGRPGGGAGAGAGFQRRGRSKVDETREVMANVVLCHVPVTSFDYQQKASIADVSPEQWSCLEWARL